MLTVRISTTLRCMCVLRSPCAVGRGCCRDVRAVCAAPMHIAASDSRVQDVGLVSIKELVVATISLHNKSTTRSRNWKTNYLFFSSWLSAEAAATSTVHTRGRRPRWSLKDTETRLPIFVSGRHSLRLSPCLNRRLCTHRFLFNWSYFSMVPISRNHPWINL